MRPPRRGRVGGSQEGMVSLPCAHRCPRVDWCQVKMLVWYALPLAPAGKAGTSPGTRFRAEAAGGLNALFTAVFVGVVAALVVKRYEARTAADRREAEARHEEQLQIRQLEYQSRANAQRSSDGCDAGDISNPNSVAIRARTAARTNSERVSSAWSAAAAHKQRSRRETRTCMSALRVMVMSSYLLHHDLQGRDFPVGLPSRT